MPKDPVPWKCDEVVDPVPLPYREKFFEREFDQIKRGFEPRDMDDKWVVRFESPYLRFYRSWTGQGIYQAELVEELKKRTVENAVCASTLLDNSNSEYQSELLEFLIGNLLLGRSLPFPIPKDLVQEQSGLYQHVISGTGYPEKQMPVRRPWWKIWR